MVGNSANKSDSEQAVLADHFGGEDRRASVGEHFAHFVETCGHLSPKAVLIEHLIEVHSDTLTTLFGLCSILRTSALRYPRRTQQAAAASNQLLLGRRDDEQGMRDFSPAERRRVQIRP